MDWCHVLKVTPGSCVSMDLTCFTLSVPPINDTHNFVSCILVKHSIAFIHFGLGERIHLFICWSKSLHSSPLCAKVPWSLTLFHCSTYVMFLFPPACLPLSLTVNTIHTNDDQEYEKLVNHGIFEGRVHRERRRLAAIERRAKEQRERAAGGRFNRQLEFWVQV